MKSTIPHLEQYSGCWAMLESAFHATASLIKRLDLRAHIQAFTPADDFGAPKVEHADGVAVIQLVGIMTKYGSSLLEGPSTLATRQAIRKAGGDSSVKAIVLLIDSPGGSTNGVQDLADDVRAANAKKPVTAYIEDTGASAAYWVASQAGRIVANSAALVGGIGTYGVVRDFSEQDKMLGIKTHVIKAGQYKGAGEPGAPVDDEQLGEFQRMVDEMNALFISAIGRGRGFSRDRVSALADGRAHIGENARRLGLVDEIGTLDDAIATAAGQSVTPTGARTMAKRESLIPKATDDFVADAQAYALEHGCSVRDAMSKLAAEHPRAHEAWVERQTERWPRPARK